jgi:dGTPase
MQDKTQVFPLSSSDYVRTRLTHSMEVASVAKSLGGLVGFALGEKRVLGEIHPLEVGMILSAATLAHDIGNPPFGHSGESAIQNWFFTSETALQIRGILPPECLADFDRYEGNAQGFRVLARLQMYRDKGGMQLTAATLGAFAKYPCSANASASSAHRGQSTKKFGFFLADRDLFREVAGLTGLVPRQTPDSWSRHPLAFLVEAADDICYRIVDFEDAFRQKLVTYKELEGTMEGLLNDQKTMDRVREAEDDDHRVDVIRSLAIREAVDCVAQAFDVNYSQIMDGSFDDDLLSQTRIAPHFAEIKRLQTERVYKNDRVLRVEAAGFKVLGGLLDAFTGAAFGAASNSGFKRTGETDKLFDLIPSQFLEADRKPSPDPYTRLLKIVDFVCGMTDSFALRLYRELSGISVP